MAKPDAWTETKPFDQNATGRDDRVPQRKRERSQPEPAEIARLYEQLPPHAIEAEMCLLGSMLLDPDCIGDIVQIVQSSDDFFKPAHGQIFDAIVHQYNLHATRLDLVTVHQQLIDKNVLDAVGGQDYLSELAVSVPTAAHATYYANMVREKAILRHLIRTGGEIIHDAYTRPDDAKSILDEAERRIFEIAQNAQERDFAHLVDLLEAELRWFTENSSPRVGLLTGFGAFDYKTGGLQRGDFIVLAARPSMGKTSLALNIAEQIALGQRDVDGRPERNPVGFFSLEMGRQQLIYRLIAARSGVNVEDLQRNNLNQEKSRRVVQACGELRHAQIIIDDSAALSLLQLRAKARRMKAKFDIRAVFIDYLQLLNLGRRTESRQIEVSEISRGLKALARELEVPVVCLSQLNRGPEQREGHRPRIADLRESGSIEQDADVVVLVHREDRYHENEPDYVSTNIAEVDIAKQRNGPTGVIKLIWDGAITRFKNASFRDADDYV